MTIFGSFFGVGAASSSGRYREIAYTLCTIKSGIKPFIQIKKTCHGPEPDGVSYQPNSIWTNI